MEQYPLPDQDYMVLIRCYTYNHEAYIEDALKGFVMQRTNFPFVAVIIDDASTDGTAEIIRQYEKEYPAIIKGIYLKENHYSQKKKKTPYVQPWRNRCKYEALCEGDDYWIDPLKLQKQVDFLENNPKYGLVYTYAKAITNDNKNKIIGNNINSIKELLQDNPIATLTVCYKINLLNKYLQEVQPGTHNWKMGDYPLWIWIYINSKIHLIEEITSIYRVLNESASHSKDISRMINFHKSVYDIKLYFIKKYLNSNKKLINLINNIKFWSIFRIYIITGLDDEAFSCLKAGKKYLSFKYYISGILMHKNKIIREKIRYKWKTNL